jgi:hypothetical protein
MSEWSYVKEPNGRKAYVVVTANQYNMVGDEIYEVDFIRVNRNEPFEAGSIVVMANKFSKSKWTQADKDALIAKQPA